MLQSVKLLFGRPVRKFKQLKRIACVDSRLSKVVIFTFGSPYFLLKDEVVQRYKNAILRENAPLLRCIKLILSFIIKGPILSS